MDFSRSIWKEILMPEFILSIISIILALALFVFVIKFVVTYILPVIMISIIIGGLCLLTIKMRY